jgi:hypothetical protein
MSPVTTGNTDATHVLRETKIPEKHARDPLTESSERNPRAVGQAVKQFMNATVDTDNMPRVERLAVRESEARQMLGGISRTSLWRIERAGFVRALPGLRTKLYSLESIRAYVGGASKGAA